MFGSCFRTPAVSFVVVVVVVVLFFVVVVFFGGEETTLMNLKHGCKQKSNSK